MKIIPFLTSKEFKKKIQFFFIWSSILTHQSCRTIICEKKRNQYRLKNNTFIEEKQVLRADTSIKQGDYRLAQKILKGNEKTFSTPNKVLSNQKESYLILIAQGTYRNNQKEGLWTENFGAGFYRTGLYEHNQKIGEWKEYFEGNLCGTGFYAQDKKINIWQYYYQNCLYFSYDYTNKRPLMRVVNELKLETFNSQDTASVILVYPYGGFRGFKNLLRDKLYWDNNPIPDEVIPSSFAIYIDMTSEPSGRIQFKVNPIHKDTNGLLKKLVETFLDKVPSEWILVTPHKPAYYTYILRISME